MLNFVFGVSISFKVISRDSNPKLQTPNQIVLCSLLLLYEAPSEEFDIDYRPSTHSEYCQVLENLCVLRAYGVVFSSPASPSPSVSDATLVSEPTKGNLPFPSSCEIEAGAKGSSEPEVPMPVMVVSVVHYAACVSVTYGSKLDSPGPQVRLTIVHLIVERDAQVPLA